MERKPIIQYSGKTIFTNGEIKMLQEFSGVTEYFEQKIIESNNISRWLQAEFSRLG